MNTNGTLSAHSVSEALCHYRSSHQSKELKSQGVTVYEFTLGEPDFLTPQHIRDAAKAAMDAGHTHYTPATGIPELKQSICDAYLRDHGLKYEPNQIAVSNGAKHAIHNVLTTLCAPGDEVIIPAPYWVSYSALVELVGATPVIIETTEESGFCLSAAQLEKSITPQTKLLMLNNPCNPTGACYPTATLEELANVIVSHDCFVLSDEIYEKLIYSGSEFRSFSTLHPSLPEKTIIVNGVSKAYAMTGWRIGWSMAPVEITQGINKLQSQQTSNPCSVSQYAAVAALSGSQDCVDEMLSEFAKRRDYVVNRMKTFPNISFAEPGGAFYIFFNVSSHFGRQLPGGNQVDNATDFCAELLEQSQVALVTGDAFGAPGYVRLSFATSQAVIETGLDRLEQFL